MKKKALIILGVLIILTPLGLLTSYDAWGEWDNEYYKQMLGFLPKGFVEANGIKPLIPDYSIPGVNEVVGYYISAIVGAVILFGIYFILAKIIKKNSETN
ncbi:cobalamin biosynthesis protein [Caminibacter mediatlanticus TB-2]|uniref:Cobalamin biosynthesis protein n=1 Tax=Caminibacter mediatlanticus TB-2 TaxID=391592 RepID=A0ABX5V9Z5_9BACT|nr:PDGLE domain-containing protein [Caminibacter mediatlanticus]QCT94409.1 cobalamin biosynthesis protein [Caminibacter mediatlanticus TB-2]